MIFDYNDKVGETGTRFTNPSIQSNEIDLVKLGRGEHELYLVPELKNTSTAALAANDDQVHANIRLLRKPESRKTRLYERYQSKTGTQEEEPTESYNAVYEWVIEPDEEEEYEHYADMYDDDDYDEDDEDDDDDDIDDDEDDEDEDEEDCEDEDHDHHKHKGDHSWDWNSKHGWKPKHEKVLKLLNPPVSASASVSVSVVRLIETIATGTPETTRTVTAPASNCNIPPVTNFKTNTIYVNPTACAPVTSIVTAIPTHITEMVTETLEHEGSPTTRVVQRTITGNIIYRYQTVTEAGVTKTVDGATRTIGGATTTIEGETRTIAGATTTIEGDVETVLVPGMTTSVAGDTVYLAGQTTTVAQGTVTEGETTTVGLNTVTIAEGTTTIPGTTVLGTQYVTKYLLQQTKITTVVYTDTQLVTVPVTQINQQTKTIIGGTSTTTENVIVTVIRPSSVTANA